MKKYLPVILFALGLAVFAGVYFFVIRGNKSTEVEEDEVVAEIPFEKRPVASLTPVRDGHWLKLVVEDIKVEAATLDYELLYRVSDGRTQGVPGQIKLNGQTKIERELLLGSESSGKFRYDEGVKEGTLTIRFRNDKGKLVGRLSTQFSLQTQTTDLASIDGKFKYTLDKAPKKGIFFVVMETFGVPKGVSNVTSGPYGVFTETGSFPGKVNLTGSVQRYANGSWEKLNGSESENIGIFVATSE